MDGTQASRGMGLHGDDELRREGVLFEEGEPPERVIHPIKEITCNNRCDQSRGFPSFRGSGV